ncbi:MAG: adenylosuccinate lyase [Candidatus Bipolaricaulaceae bacterium]
MLGGGMLDRYALSPMKELWTLGAQYERWLAVELAALQALEELGQVPEGTVAEVQARARVDLCRIQDVERQVGHDLLAFLWTVEEQVGPAGRWLHLGLTSSDVKDTALALTLREALDILLGKADRLGRALWRLADDHRTVPMVGRTHGQYAEPTTFGLKVLVWYDELGRVSQRLSRARDAVSAGKLSGAVGTYAHFPLQAEARALSLLGLEPCPVSTQVIARDRHAEVVFALAAAGSLVEKIALEVRHLCRSEVAEVAEGRPEGSSAMPHKQNPILSERLCGLARLLRSALGPALEDNALWHERDMSHSSVERVLLPQTCLAADYALDRAERLVRSLVVFPDRMAAHLRDAGGLPYSEGLLLTLVRTGLSRQRAHRHVEGLCGRARREGRELREVAGEDELVAARLSPQQLAAVFDPEAALRRVEAVFRRVSPPEQRV